MFLEQPAYQALPQSGEKDSETTGLISERTYKFNMKDMDSSESDEEAEKESEDLSS